jgi:hypothetical protein
MLIGATDADVVNIALAVMCSTKAGGDDPYNNKSFYSGYACSYNGYSYDGTCPVQTPGPSAYPFTTIQPLASWQLNWWTGGGPSCKYYPGATANSDGSWPTAGPPCGFACHSDGSGAGNDPYGVVRASPLNIELRLDAVKNAVKSLISNMTSENFGTLNNLRIGIWDFNFSLNQDYPTDGTAAGSDWTAAANAVGGTTTGIQPHVTTGSTPDTDFDNAMTNLASQLGNAGNGKSTDTARKALFLLTDGVSSSPESGLASGPFSTNYCTTMKQKGYTIYVVYTPYYSLPHTAYFGLAAPLTQPLTNSQVTTALQACASTPSDFIAATDDASLTAALKTFLRAELANPVGFTK